MEISTQTHCFNRLNPLYKEAKRHASRNPLFHHYTNTPNGTGNEHTIIARISNTHFFYFTFILLLFLFVFNLFIATFAKQQSNWQNEIVCHLHIFAFLICKEKHRRPSLNGYKYSIHLKFMLWEKLYLQHSLCLQ